MDYNIAAVTALLILVAGVTVIAAKPPLASRRAWIVPAVLSLAFFCLTLYAVLTEGPVGFWAVHIQSAWSIQIWVDLLLAFAIGWTFLVSQAKSLGMRVWPWLIFFLCTGCIGLLAMFARVLYLREIRNENSSDLSTA